MVLSTQTASLVYYFQSLRDRQLLCQWIPAVLIRVGLTPSAGARTTLYTAPVCLGMRAAHPTAGPSAGHPASAPVTWPASIRSAATHAPGPAGPPLSARSPTTTPCAAASRALRETPMRVVREVRTYEFRA